MSDSRVECLQTQELLPLYALGALQDGECAPVAAHVARCPNCARELADYVAVAEALAESVPLVQAPAALEARVLAAIGAQPEAPVPGRGARLAWLRDWSRGSRLAVAVLSLLVLVLGGITLRLNRELAQTRTEIARLSAALAASDTTPIAMVGEPDQAPRAHGRFLYAEHTRDGALIVEGLPALPEDRVYQLWLVRKDGGRDNGGLFRPDEQGRAWLALQAARPWSEYSALGVTIEPKGGSPGPTGPRVLRSEM